MISNKYFKKISTSHPKPTKNPLPYYQQVWSQYYYFSQPAQIQKILSKKTVEEQNKSINYNLEKLNSYEDSLFVNARNRPPKKLMKIKEFKEALKTHSYEKALQKVKQKYGENSYLAFMVKTDIILAKCPQISKERGIIEINQIKEELESRNMMNSLYGASILDQLFLFYLQNNDLEKVADILKQALRIRKKFVKSPSIELAKHYFFVSLSYASLDQVEESIKILENAIEEVFNSKEDIDQDFLQILSMNSELRKQKAMKLCKFYKDKKPFQKHMASLAAN